MQAAETRGSGAGGVATVVGGLVLCLVINYHSYLSDFNLVPGDRGDARLLIFTLEHWFRVFQGQEGFFALHMFHPDSMALAYSDGLFLLGIPYSVFRWMGSDPFTSYQFVFALLTVAGYLGWLLLMRKALGLQTGFAVLAAVLLSSMNSIQFQADNGQLRSVLLYPLLALLLWGFAVASVRRHSPATLCLIGFVGGLALLFFTSYYAAWFFLFALILLGLLALLAECVFDAPSMVLRGAAGFVRACRWQLIAALAAFTIGLIPFLMTYAPLIEANASRSFNLVLQFAPRPTDLINVSPGNLAWSPVLRLLHFNFGNREVQTGSPPLVLLMAGISLMGLVSRLRRTGWQEASGADRFMLLLIITGAMLAAMSVQVQDRSVWYLIYRLVPGASALRALGRILVIVDIIIIVGAIYGMEKAFRASSGMAARKTAWLSAGAGLLGFLLITEQVNDVRFRLDKSAQLAFIDRFSAPEVTCEAFFINGSEPPGLPHGYYHLDAMMISMQLGIPTVNGYSGFEPHKAFGLPTRGIDYKYQILDWLKSRGAVSGICELDYSTAEFHSTNVEQEFQADRQLYLASYLETFSRLHEAATEFLEDGNALTDLHPRYLEEHGYLDPEMGYETGARYRWIQGRYWIGEKPCSKSGCFGIGVVGNYEEVRGILAAFGDKARRVLYPSPQVWTPDEPPPQGSSAELMLIFAADDYRH